MGRPSSRLISVDLPTPEEPMSTIVEPAERNGESRAIPSPVTALTGITGIPGATGMNSSASDEGLSVRSDLLITITGRAPVMVRLGIGPLRVDTTDGKSHYYLIDGGIAQMKQDTLTVLTTSAIPATEIDGRLSTRTDVAVQRVRWSDTRRGRNAISTRTLITQILSLFSPTSQRFIA